MFLALCVPALSHAYDVTVLKSSDIKPYDDAMKGFRSSCDCNVRELNLLEIQNGVVREVLKSNPDAILAIGLDAFEKVKGIEDRPVIYAMIPHRPAESVPENISGVSMVISPEKYLDTMLEVLPGSTRIGVIYDPKNTGWLVEEAIQVAGEKGITLISKKTHSRSDVPSLIDSLKGRIDMFWMLPDPTILSKETIDYLLLFSFQNKVPVFTFSKKYVEMGALAGLNIVPFDIGAQAGEIAKKMISEKDDKKPIRKYARKAVLILNSRIAEKLGLKINKGTLNRAEDVNR